ncbi:unnamed protein product [Timema podura]|uniref:Eclosion hormone n=1 Tax=Timema podura TaxID=61482 RepID=A0ABN7NMF0_TIMPD|nr:unnamed protein product [Timema podura]
MLTPASVLRAVDWSVIKCRPLSAGYVQYSSLAVMTLLCWSEISSAPAVAICITNCGQCQQMFGHFFQGRVCAEACLSTGGFISPDCNNPSSIRRFILKRTYS